MARTMRAKVVALLLVMCLPIVGCEKMGLEKIDNEPPAVIEGFILTITTDGAVSLNWSPSLAEDLAHYLVYQSNDGSFNPLYRVDGSG